MCSSDLSSPNLSHVVVQGLRQMIDIRGGKSLFTSTGVSMFLFPVSITALLFTGHFTGSAGYLLLCWLGFVAAILIIRENASDSTSFFHLRQAYVLLIIMHLFNALAFGAFLAKGWAIPCYTYLAIYAVNLAHQAYKIIRHQISDTIHEEGLHTHPKTPEPYSVVLRDYLTNLETPVVVMGSHMAWGEMHNFFQWNENLRSVDLETKVDDEIIATQIKRHGVTHIALTPMSWYPTPGKCSIRLPELGPLLKDQLIRHEISDDVTIFEVLGTAPGQRKEAI